MNCFFLRYSLDEMIQIEYLSANVTSYEPGGIGLFLIWFIVSLPPQIILTSQIDDRCFVIPSDLSYLIILIFFCKLLNFFLFNSLLIIFIKIFDWLWNFVDNLIIFVLPVINPKKRLYAKFSGTFEGVKCNTKPLPYLFSRKVEYFFLNNWCLLLYKKRQMKQDLDNFLFLYFQKF